jgi:hypothetical protein
VARWSTQRARRAFFRSCSLLFSSACITPFKHLTSCILSWYHSFYNTVFVCFVTVLFSGLRQRWRTVLSSAKGLLCFEQQKEKCLSFCCKHFWCKRSASLTPSEFAFTAPRLCSACPTSTAKYPSIVFCLFYSKCVLCLHRVFCIAI